MPSRRTRWATAWPLLALRVYCVGRDTQGISFPRRDQARSGGQAAPVRSATREERRKEVEEVLRVNDTVVIEVRAECTGEQYTQEIEEVL
jgi:hypothetical protein